MVMKKIAYIIIAAAAIAAASCAKEAPVAPQSKVILTATLENSKTILTEENTVEWVAGDKVSVFEGSTNVQTTALQGGASTSLEGEITTSGPWYALYPYNADATISEGIITTTLPANQKAAPGTFADGLNISVAYSETSTLAFKNVLSYVKFTVSNDLVRKVTITGAADEALAGTIAIDYNAGQPTYSVVEGSKSIVLEPEGEYFEKDAVYYAAILPQTLPSGFNITYNDAFNEDHVATSTNAPVFKRSVTLNIGSPDSEFQIDGPITFECAAVEADLLKAGIGGTIEAGKIYKSEAARTPYSAFESYCVTDKSSPLWTDVTSITSFDEFKYFVGLHYSETQVRTPNIFYGCSMLTTLTFPYNTQAIANYTCMKCSSLTAINLPAGVHSVFGHAFDGCAAVTKLTFEAGADNILKQVSTYAFNGCKKMSLSTRNMKKLETIGTYAFQNCEKIQNLTISSSNLKTIGRNAFYQCKALVNVYISPKIEKIDQFAFSGCIALTGLSGEGTSKTGINLPEGCTTLGKAAFGGCYNIKDVVFPSTITTIDENVFRTETVNSTERVINLDSWTIKATAVPTLGANPFLKKTNTGSVAHIYVPAASVDAYKAAANWKNYASIIEAIPAE